MSKDTPVLPDDYSPDDYSIASNGAIRSKDTGRIVAHQPGGLTNVITPENANEFQQHRQQKQIMAALAAEGGLASAFKNNPTAYSAWSHIVEKQAQLSTKDDYTSTKAADFVGKATGYLSSGGNGADPVPPGGARLELGSGVVEDIFKYIQEYRDTSTE